MISGILIYLMCDECNVETEIRIRCISHTLFLSELDQIEWAEIAYKHYCPKCKEAKIKGE